MESRELTYNFKVVVFDLKIPETYPQLRLDRLDEDPSTITFYRGISGIELEDFLATGRNFSPGSQQVALDHHVDNITWLTREFGWASHFGRDRDRLRTLSAITSVKYDEFLRSGVIVYGVNGNSIDFERMRRFFNDRNMIPGLDPKKVYDYVFLGTIGLDMLSEVYIVEENGTIKGLVNELLKLNKTIQLKEPPNGREETFDLEKLIKVGFITRF